MQFFFFLLCVCVWVRAHHGVPPGFEPVCFCVSDWQEHGSKARVPELLSASGVSAAMSE